MPEVTQDEDAGVVETAVHRLHRIVVGTQFLGVRQSPSLPGVVFNPEETCPDIEADLEAAAEAKVLGTNNLKTSNFAAAVESYSTALRLTPINHESRSVLFLNR